MKWYGELVDDFKARVPKTLPPYTEDSKVEKLLSAIKNKKTHRGCMVRDVLLAGLDLKTGTRRGELAELEARTYALRCAVPRNSGWGAGTGLNTSYLRDDMIAQIAILFTHRLFNPGFEADSAGDLTPLKSVQLYGQTRD